MDKIAAELSKLESLGLLRSLETRAARVDFAANDYLGFSAHPAIRAGLIEFLERDVRLGSTGSRLISGNSLQAEELEASLSSAFGSEAALLFGSGYMANLGVCAALGGEGTEFFSDRLNHASLIDGMRLARAPISIFKHNDLTDLERQLRASHALRKVVVTESVFSMDGDSAPLREIVSLTERYEAYLVVDEAHGTGVTGAGGLGEMAALNFDREKTLIVHTCGKALGAYGAFVCSSLTLKNFLINRARTLIYTTALSPIALEQIRLSLRQLLLEPERVLALQSNCVFMARELAAIGFTVSPSHILPLILGGNDEVMSAAAYLGEKGFFIKGIRSPTVAKGQERLRLTLNSQHTEDEMREFAQELKGWKDESLRRRH